AGDRIRVAGLLGSSDRHTGRLVQQYQVLGRPEDAAEILKDLELHGINVSRIVVTTAFERLSSEAQQALLGIEEASEIKLELFSEWAKLDVSKFPRVRMGSSGADNENDSTAFAITDVELQTLAGRPYWRFKRLVDVTGAVCLLVLTAPFSLIVA